MQDQAHYIQLYRSLSDERLSILVQSEFAQLLPEAQTALTIVIRERGLDEKIQQYRAAATKPVTDADIDNLINNRALIPCPHCGNRDSSFNVIQFFQFVYIYVMFCWETRTMVGCAKCLIQQMRSVKTTHRFLLFMPPVQTLISILYLRKIDRIIRKLEADNSPTEYLRPYIEKYYLAIKGQM